MTRPARRRWGPFLASVGVHAGLVLAWWLAAPATGAGPIQIQPLAVAPLHLAGFRELTAVAAPPRATLPRAEPKLRAAKSAPPATDPGPITTTESRSTDTAVTGPVASTVPIGRDLGDGRLWVRPLTPDQLGLVHRLFRTTAEQTDTVIKAAVRAYLDSLELVAATAPGPPSWVGKIVGARFGLDSRFVYLAGLRIPSVLLALLPIPATGNQSRAFDRSGAMFEDLQRAAIRDATLDDFRAAVVELRAREELEHRLREGQASDPAPEKGPTSATP